MVEAEEEPEPRDMLGVGVVVDLPDALDVDLISQLFPLDAVTDDRLDDCDLLVAL